MSLFHSFPLLADAGSIAQQLALVAIVIGALTLWIGQWLPSETVSVLVIAGLAATGVLDTRALLSGFAHEATVTIGAMFILSAGLVRTGALEFVALRMGDLSRGSPTRLLLMLAVLVPPASAFVNNTPIVVMMVPVILSLCRRFDIKPSKLLIPLSYLSILGGTCTLLGTTTNILVSDLYADRVAGSGGFDVFDFTPLGLVYLLVGSVFILLFSNRLLPERSSLSGLLHPERKADFVTEVIVPADSPLVGRKAGEVFEGSPVQLLELMRGEEILLAPQAKDHVIEPENSLIVEGKPQEIDSFLGASGAALTSVVEDDTRVPMKTFELMLAEAVVLPDSPFEGLTVSELGLNRRFGVKVMAVQRQGRRHRYRIRAMRLQAGDVLLIQADAMGLAALRETEGMLVVEGVDQTLVRPRKAPIAIGVMIAVVLVAALGGVPLVIPAVGGVALMLLTRCMRVDEALRSLDGAVLLLLAAAIPLGLALDRTGLAGSMAGLLEDAFGEADPRVFLSAFYLGTSLLTAILQNHAVAALLVPIALGLAGRLGINHESLLMAVCFGASASFITPIGYQTNTIVMGPGGYTFRDYLRIGIPMHVLMWIAATWLIPLFWPLNV